VKGRTEPYPAWKYRWDRWKEKEVSTMEGILFDIEMFSTPIGPRHEDTVGPVARTSSIV